MCAYRVVRSAHGPAVAGLRGAVLDSVGRYLLPLVASHASRPVSTVVSRGVL